MKKIINKFCKLSIVAVIIVGIISTNAGIQYLRVAGLKTSTDHATPYNCHISSEEMGAYSRDRATLGEQGVHRLHIDGSDPYEPNVYCANMNAQIPSTDDWYTTSYMDITESGLSNGTLLWILDNMYIDGTDDADFNLNVFHQIIRKYGGVEDTNSIVSSLSSDDIYVINQNLIWLAINGHYERISGGIIDADPNGKRLVMDAYWSGAPTDYTRNTSGNISLSSEGATLSEDGVIGPLTINGNGSMYHMSWSGTVGSDTASINVYKDAACTEGLYEWDDHYGQFYAKILNYRENETVTFHADLKYAYTTDASYYTATSNDTHLTTVAQPLLSVRRATKTVSVDFSGKNEREQSGDFSIKLVKYEKGKSVKLPGATFKVTIPELNYTDTKTTDSNGEITFNRVNIDAENRTYNVTVTEEDAPDGYVGIDGPISFQVTTQLVSDTKYKLVPNTSMTVANAKKVEVAENQILIEAENRPTSIDIHKGVKTVENQDSGYYSVDQKIKELLAKQSDSTGPEYIDDTTGKKYTDVELEDLQHEWVVETTIPEGISEYNRYMVVDPIDTTKLDFSGLDRVKVELINSSGSVVKTLVRDTDYTARYENNTLTVTYIDKKDGNNFYGEFLGTATTSNKIRITFNTTFKVNPETGKLVVLENAITNAENQARLRYDNGSGTDQERLSENPEVHTGAVSVFKYEDTNGNGKHDEGEKALVGAEFKLALSEEDAKNGKYVRIGGVELTAISNEHGIATFTGLSFGGDAKDDEKNLRSGLYRYDWEKASRDYYIVETKSPSGYKKLEDNIKVTVSKDSSEIIDLTDKINEMESVGNMPLKFDLALRKWVTQAIVTENGKTVIYETGHHAEDDPEDIVKVDLKKSKLGQVKVQFRYSIRITNEGEIAGEAREITDYIPEGLKFVQEDNPGWTTTDDERIVKTRLLEGVTLEPGESAEVEILLTWVNSADSMGVMINTAEISEDYNEYGVHDIDSTPNNKKWGEDDIDDAPVMLAIKTGSETIGYVTIGISFVTIITLGTLEIKKRIL
ncbi:MAG: Cys-Gln thioester bond-forming surface protein [Clostridia bacterium]|nr:Cys-Gln thioester bond-forming surface protein [Clostridia bacterium]